MLIQKIDIYAIPGWGFKSSIFNIIKNNNINFIGLDYIHLSKLPLVKIAKHLSNLLPNQVILLGWSFGSQIATQLAHSFPHKVKKLILLSSQPSLKTRKDWMGINQEDAHNFKKGFINNFSKQLHYFIKIACYPNKSLDIRKALNHQLLIGYEQELKLLLNILFDIDLRKEYRNLNMDILQLISNLDAVIPQSSAQLKDLNPRIRTRTFKNTGHAGFIINNSQYINAILDFLNYD